MSDFYNTRKVTTRKPHRCAQCSHIIPAGTKCFYSSGVFEGDFMSDYEHLDCHAAWLVLEAESLRFEAYAPFLIEDVQQEWAPILAKDFPSVHARLFQKGETP